MMSILIRMVCLLALLVLTIPGTVSAHAELVSSTPEAGSTVKAAPATVVARFSEKVGSAGSTIVVKDAQGAEVSSGAATIDSADASGKTMVVNLKSGLGDGTYTVEWTTVSGADGDKESGSFKFTVSSGASSASPAPSASAQPSGGTPGEVTTQQTTTLPNTGAAERQLALLITLGVLLCGLGLSFRRRSSSRA
jgi:copper resistance protein C